MCGLVVTYDIYVSIQFLFFNLEKQKKGKESAEKHIEVLWGCLGGYSLHVCEPEMFKCLFEDGVLPPAASITASSGSNTDKNVIMNLKK